MSLLLTVIMDKLMKSVKSRTRTSENNNIYRNLGLIRLNSWLYGVMVETVTKLRAQVDLWTERIEYIKMEVIVYKCTVWIINGNE